MALVPTTQVRRGDRVITVNCAAVAHLAAEGWAEVLPEPPGGQMGAGIDADGDGDDAALTAQRPPEGEPEAVKPAGKKSVAQSATTKGPKEKSGAKKR